ncbi:MAG TPA: A24 family peptidase [Candidatus Binataceae bacterium]|nr:A24 family peptidase [Candidatus Binataceae bacterium]
MEIPRGIAALFCFVVGASVGSFVNVVAYRLPREISIAAPRSFCPRCNRPIPVWANIPMVAYIGLRGRCLMCGGAIPFRYFLTELALASAAAYLYLSFPFGDAVARFALCAGLFAVALIDYDWRVIPNIITFPGIPIGIVAAWLLMPEVGWRNSALGVLVGAGFLFITGELYMLIRGAEGVGLGDVWLMGAIGAFLGWAGVLFTLFVGSILGAIGGIAFGLAGGAPPPPEEEVPKAIADVTGAARVGENEAESSLLQTAVPFGPFLALAAGIFALFQPQLARWYFSG